MSDMGFTQQGGLTDLDQYEVQVFDWLIMEGANHDYTCSEIIPQFEIENLDLFLGCPTTDDPSHVVEVAVLVPMQGDFPLDYVWEQIGAHLPHKPEGVWFDVTNDDRPNVWVVLSLTAEELEQPYLDYRMRTYLDFAHGVDSHLDDMYWLD